MKVGAQLYTVREFMQDLPSVEESLKKVADMGYKYIQLSGGCPFDPEWMREQLDKNGLTCVLTHYRGPALTDDPEAVVKEHDILGCKYIGLGSFDLAGKGIDAFEQAYRHTTEVFKEHGKLFMYHNHNREFSKVDGKLIMDHILERFTPEEMGITLDCFWVQSGGADPAAWIRKLKGRTPVIHMKDMGFGMVMDRFTKEMRPGQMIMPIGEGNMNYDSLLTAAIESGVEYAMVELDTCNGEDPFDCLKRSLDFLKKWGCEAE
ncbi:MAG: sugar phosphate isomerase/epimerase [Firmicutes bacterium]|nr:sugar phosphate isomerase/epimerase [Bacillota bacterium]